MYRQHLAGRNEILELDEFLFTLRECGGKRISEEMMMMIHELKRDEVDEQKTASRIGLVSAM
jgi:hypothetical protein